jgi:hypothetical protein
MFITMFTKTRQWTVSLLSLLKSKLSYTISLKCILILSFHLHLHLSGASLLSGSPTRVLYEFLISPMFPTFHQHWFYHPINIWWRVQIMKIFIIQLSLACCCFFTLIIQAFSSTSYSQTPSVYVHPLRVSNTTRVSTNSYVKFTPSGLWRHVVL